MYIVILAGGSGTRFWPLSRKKSPKQLMSVFGGKSMLQRTVDRVLPLHPRRVLIVTNSMQAEETARQLAYVTEVPLDIIEEPVGRNTAPAIGLAATAIFSHDPDGVMVVLPADHYITDENGFRETVRQALAAATNGSLVTLGITPTRPETGYGYIEAEPAAHSGAPCPVKRFVEKPNREKALEFLLSGNFYWNSGMFIWKAATILEQLATFMPALSAALSGISSRDNAWNTESLNDQVRTIYAGIAGESIDFGVLEKATIVQVIASDFGWSDVGSWSAIPEVVEAGSSGHVGICNKELISVDAEGCMVYGDNKLVGLVGVRDLIVVATPDALLVCAKDRAQEVKKVVEELERRGLAEYL